jgi:hypothetical protein
LSQRILPFAVLVNRFEADLFDFILGIFQASSLNTLSASKKHSSALRKKVTLFTLWRLWMQEKYVSTAHDHLPASPALWFIGSSDLTQRTPVSLFPFSSSGM